MKLGSFAALLALAGLVGFSAVAAGGHHRGAYGHSSIGFYWGPGFWPGYYPFSPYYYPPAVITVPVPTEPPTYIERNAPSTPAQPLPPNFWYYCSNPAGYYPSVGECPGGWQQVAPRPDSNR